ncbi:MAG: DUF1848 domain-containing protein [Spirochaetaceae bacterium]|jgi:DNA repair photolyase|nr:DUF1848 domain-containing protein [Spirochaetaceae bacterium]
MIISASRRTDIPAYYSDWMINRINEGFVYSQNPFNPRQIREIRLSPALVDGIVFWSKNPEPMTDKLDALKEYAYYFQFTLNSYSSDIEPNLPPREKRLETFMKLSGKTGPERVVWRYDPIIINERYTASYHIDKFGESAGKLGGYTKKVIFSFVDFYKKIEGRLKSFDVREAEIDEKRKIAESIALIAKSNGLPAAVCAEDMDFGMYGISRACCVDSALISEIKGSDVRAVKDRNQRSDCLCAASVDIGAYNSCQNGCVYCYANHNPESVKRNSGRHDKFSPLLIG